MWSYCLIPVGAVYGMIGFGVGRAAYHNIKIPQYMKFVVAMVNGILWPIVLGLGLLDRQDEMKSHQSLSKYDLKK